MMDYIPKLMPQPQAAMPDPVDNTMAKSQDVCDSERDREKEIEA